LNAPTAKRPNHSGCRQLENQVEEEVALQSGALESPLPGADTTYDSQRNVIAAASRLS
jgi:hypothetical protein